MREAIGEEGAEESAGLVDGDDVGLEERERGIVVRVEAEFVLEGGEGEGGADEGAVVADHAGGEGGDGGAGPDAPVVDILWERGVSWSLMEWEEEDGRGDLPWA